MKVVFLDIDGVLNCHRTCIALGGIPHRLDPASIAQLDPVGLSLIRRIVAASGAKVVLSSTWRILHDWRDVGTALQLPIIGATPRGTLKGTMRGHEIAEWLENHVECTHYAIIDDDSDMLPGQMPYFVKTSGFDGFTWSNAEKLAQVLGIDVWDAVLKLGKL